MSKLLQSCLIFMSLISINLMASELTLPALFADHMVLQRDQQLKIWGQAKAGDTVEVELAQGKTSVQADANGQWLATLKPQPAGGPYSLLVKTQSQSLRFNDVWLGEVWVASGQSNMEWKLGAQTENWQQEVQDSNLPQIRFYTLPKTLSALPNQPVPAASWIVASPETVADFSAIGWFFAKQNHLQKGVAVGVIDATWGGTAAEAWTPAQALLNVPGYEKDAADMQAQPEVWQQRIEENKQKDQQKWQLIASNAGIEQLKLAEPATDDSQWQKVSLPNAKPLSDIVWLRKTVKLEKAPAQASLFFGDINQIGRIFVNGQQVAEESWADSTTEIKLPAGLLKAGDNLIALRVINSWDNKVSVGRAGQLWLKADASQLNLEGDWRYKNDAEPQLPDVKFLNWKPGVLFNAMIKPLMPYAVKGVIWYQGESNGDKPQYYHKLFSTLIQSWRQHWQQPLPFLYVQLASYMKPQPYPMESNWAELREAQTKTLALPQTAMAVITDLGDIEDVHPRRKKPVAERLYLAARAVVYAEDVLYSGPVLKSIRVRDSGFRLSFDQVGTGLSVQGDQLLGFAIAGHDGKYHNAQAKLLGTDQLLVWSEQVKTPVSIRFGWADYTYANLYNSAGLPAVPFRAGEKLKSDTSTGATP
ncbi:sialate O-acetylesterase [Rheinheimera sediminis]|uniref:sialate O-acetylesterase n=1 Tax=Rheinheimera sp. YQF-1 TaxID=2499626 RepID=UPI000FDC657F|nr:sialate O-acetylesterase [Rheinheimera sp. YQF-1]RVT46026.1 sialate O-acetylesterase [Rheinheimera sp. YQF-1]